MFLYNRIRGVVMMPLLWFYIGVVNGLFRSDEKLMATLLMQSNFCQ